MRRAPWVSLLVLATVMLVATSCGDSGPIDPPVPNQTPENSLVGSLLQATGLLTCSPLPYDSTVQTIGPMGGVLRVGPHVLAVPPGALPSPVTITAIAPSGNVNLIRFRPEGLQFARSAALTMSYANCNLISVLLPKRIAYTGDHLQILELLLSIDNIFARMVTGQLNHFSGYAIAY
jgi:hypothetical protein